VEVPRTGTSLIREVTKQPLERHIDLMQFDFNNYFKCAFVRNPFDRVASLYEHTKTYHEIGAFKEFVDWYVSDQDCITKSEIRKTQFDMLNINGRMAMDWVGRFENFEYDMHWFLNVVGFPQSELPVVNKLKKEHYKEYYTNYTRKLIKRFVQKDLDEFKYSW